MEHPQLNPVTIWNAGITSGGFTHYTTTLAPGVSLCWCCSVKGLLEQESILSCGVRPAFLLALLLVCYLDNCLDACEFQVSLLIWRNATQPQDIEANELPCVRYLALST